MRIVKSIIVAVSILIASTAFGASPDNSEKVATSAKLLIKNKDYTSAKAVLADALKSKPNAPDLLLLAATCDENLGSSLAAMESYKRCIAALDADPAHDVPNIRQQATAGIKRLDDSDKLVAKYSAILDEESQKQKAKNERAARILEAGVRALRDALKETSAASAETTDASGSGERTKDAKAKSVPTQPAKIAIEAYSQFSTARGEAFPREFNLARGGRAEASSSHAECDDPSTVLGGARKVSTWCLRGADGWWRAEWPAAVVGRYVLIFNRPGGGDHWKSGVVEINGHEIAKVGDVATGMVILLDLGEPIAIKTLRITIKGVDNAGITGVEIHKALRG